MPVIAPLRALTEEAMLNILTQPHNALVKQYKKLFEMEGVSLEFSENALKEVAKMAMEKKTGARGLRSILEASLLEIMYLAPGKKDIDTCTITKDVIQNKGQAVLKKIKKTA